MRSYTNKLEFWLLLLSMATNQKVGVRISLGAPFFATDSVPAFLGALRGHAKFPLITFSYLEDQAAPQNSFIFTKCVDSIQN
jgi:hypothetical protein